jgi:hypothetical protein
VDSKVFKVKLPVLAEYQDINGKYGEALSFNGTTDYALTSYSSTFNLAQDHFLGVVG